MLNSRLGRFTAASISPSHKAKTARHPFSRSYGVNLPSSLTRVLPIALVCSTRLPASVCGTVAFDLARRFSCRIGSVESAFAFHSLLGVEMRGRICLSSPPTSLDAHSQSALNLPFPVTPLLPRSLLIGCLDRKTCLSAPASTAATPCGANDLWRYRNINRLSIAYGFRPRLRPD